MHLEDTGTSSINTENIDSDNVQNADDADGKGDKADENAEVPVTSPTPDAPPPTPTQAPNTYTSAQIATHNTESSCWASIGGNVYDLTSWISRHPGGSRAILSLCGTDGTAKFEAKHGGSSSAKAALALLKIGTLIE